MAPIKSRKRWEKVDLLQLDTAIDQFLDYNHNVVA